MLHFVRQGTTKIEFARKKAAPTSSAKARTIPLVHSTKIVAAALPTLPENPVDARYSQTRWAGDKRKVEAYIRENLEGGFDEFNRAVTLAAPMLWNTGLRCWCIFSESEVNAAAAILSYNTNRLKRNAEQFWRYQFPLLPKYWHFLAPTKGYCCFCSSQFPTARRLAV